MAHQNSLVTFLQGYIEALFLDIAPMYSQHSEWKRDKSRLLHELAFQGERVLTLDMPAVGKHLERCLAEGLYVPGQCYLGSSVSKTVVVPGFLRDLYLQIFYSDGKLRDAPCVDAIFCIRQLAYGAKKLRLMYTKRSLKDEIDDFIFNEQTCRDHTFQWDCDDLFDRDGLEASQDWDAPCLFSQHEMGAHSESCALPLRMAVPEREISFTDIVHGDDRQSEDLFPHEIQANGSIGRTELATLQSICDKVASGFGDLSIESPHERPKHGPGIVANQRKHTSKYAFNEWPRKLDAQFPHDLYASTDFGTGYDCERDVGITVNETGSRLIAVPKTRKGPRLIAAEPNQHQWIQQLVRNQIEARLERTPISSSIHFRDQTWNRDFARRGSIDSSLSTIDLSSASDRLSCWTVERAFRANLTLLERLHAARTRWISSDIEGLEFNLKLKKFAAQGSAVTFPVQSIVYACVAVTAVILANGKPPSTRNIRWASSQISVFGDDIVVPANASELTIQLLEVLGLKVNRNKTFESGNFRESCGLDAYRGYDVTPAYILEPKLSVPLSQVPSQVEVSNNFFKKGLWNLSMWIDSSFNRFSHRLPIIGPGTDFLGRYSFCGGRVDHLKSRFSDDLHREECRMLVVTNKQATLPTAGSYRLFQWFIEEPLPETNWVSGTRGNPVVHVRPGWVPMDKIVDLSTPWEERSLNVLH